MNTDICIVKACYYDIYDRCCLKPNDEHNWLCKVKDILYLYGFQDVWLSHDATTCNIDLFMSEFKAVVEARFISEMGAYYDEPPKCAL